MATYVTPTYVAIKFHHQSVNEDIIKDLHCGKECKLIAWRDNTTLHLVDATEKTKKYVRFLEKELKGIHSDVCKQGNYLLFNLDEGSFCLGEIEEYVQEATKFEFGGEVQYCGGLEEPVNIWRWGELLLAEYEICI